jgi:hypothetical protein
VPLHIIRTGIEADVTFEVSESDPRTVLFSVSPAMLGEHHIEFGDGTSTVVQVETLPMQVEHTYPAQTPLGRFVTVTLPDGRIAKGEVNGAYPCPPSFNVNYPGQCTITWYYPPNSCGEYGRDVFAPLTVDNGVHPVHRLHCPNINRETGQPGGWHAAFGYRGFSPGVYTFHYRRAIGAPTSHEVRVTKSVGSEPTSISQLRLDGDDVDIAAWFGVLTEWEGGYSGEFTVANFTESDSDWQVEFTVDAPGVVREVLSSTVVLTQLDETRWRLRPARPLQSYGTVAVGVRIEPPGAPEAYPYGITASVPE